MKIGRHLSESFTRTRGGDPPSSSIFLEISLVLPARAGVILTEVVYEDTDVSFTHTRVGDPSLDGRND